MMPQHIDDPMPDPELRGDAARVFESAAADGGAAPQ
jgi:hypothetical protein